METVHKLSQPRLTSQLQNIDKMTASIEYGKPAIAAGRRAIVLLIAFFLSTFSAVLIVAYARGVPLITSIDAQTNPDAVHYVNLARNIIEKGVYSRHPDAIGEPDILRTPGYPIFIIGTLSLRVAASLYIAQAVLIAACIIFTYRLGKRTHDHRSGIIAAAFMATDILVLTSCFEAMSEILFLFLTLLALDILQWPQTHPKSPRSLTRIFTGGIVLGVSTLTRPSNYLCIT